MAGMRSSGSCTDSVRRTTKRNTGKSKIYSTFAKAAEITFSTQLSVLIHKPITIRVEHFPKTKISTTAKIILVANYAVSWTLLAISCQCFFDQGNIIHLHKVNLCSLVYEQHMYN